jgi:hypothetical protein
VSSFKLLLLAWIGADGLVRELSEHITQVINWRRQQSYYSLKWWFARSTRVAAARNEGFRALKGFRKGLALSRSDCLLERWKVVTFLLFNVLKEIFHENLEGWSKLGA